MDIEKIKHNKKIILEIAEALKAAQKRGDMWRQRAADKGDLDAIVEISTESMGKALAERFYGRESKW